MIRTVTFILGISLASSAMAQTNTAAGVDFRGGDWENGIVGTNGMFRTLQAGEAHNFRRVTSPVRQGNYSARIELRYGDTAGPSGTSRAEVAHAFNSTGTELYPRAGETTYLGFSVMLDKTWIKPDGWGILTQLHSEAGPPAFTVQATDRFKIILNGGNTCTTSNFKTLEFKDGALNLGQWTDLLVRIKWGASANGEIQVWRRNQSETTFREVLNVVGVSNIKSCASSFYWKHGFYRDKTTPHTNILYLDGFSWGKTRDGVMAHAFSVKAPAPSPTPAPGTGGVTAIKLEAEAGRLVAPMQAYSAGGTSGGKYVATPEIEQGSVSYPLNITQAGTYALEAMVRGTGSGNNSFFVNFDSQPQKIWHFPVSTGFRTVRYAECNYTGLTCKPLSVYLSAGTHRLTITGRERDAAIDTLTLIRLGN